MHRTLFLTFVLFLSTLRVQATEWSVYAGSDGGFGAVDATGPAARFHSPFGVAGDSQGNVYVADSGNSTIRKITSAGAVTTLAGVAGDTGTDDGTGAAARFVSPLDMVLIPATAVAAFGVPVDSVVVADASRIRVVTPQGVVITLAGSEDGFVDGTGAEARFNNIISLAVNATGTVYVLDGSSVRTVTPAGVVTTLAGSPTETGYVDDTGTAARFAGAPGGLAILPGGDVLVGDRNNHRMRVVTPGGVVTTYPTTPDSTPSTYGMIADAAGNVYFTDENRVLKVDAAAGHSITPIAGAAGMAGFVDGQGTDARFGGPHGISLDSDGDVIVAASDNHAIRKVTLGGMVTTLAGKGAQAGSVDGTGTDARFNMPWGLGVDASGTVYVADSQNGTVRAIAMGGVVTTLAGQAGNPGFMNGMGTDARFSYLHGLAAQANGTLFIADTGNDKVRIITPEKEVSTLASGLDSPISVAVAPGGGALALTGSSYHSILGISPDGTLSTVAGTADTRGAGDGTGTDASFSYPSGVAIDAAGTIYVADTVNNAIRKIAMPGAIVTTLAGGGDGLDDGVGAGAAFNRLEGVAVDAVGNVYVADTGNHAIRKVTPTGRVITIGGGGGEGSAVGVGSAATFKIPHAIAVAPDGTLYVCDENHRIVKGVDDSTEAPFLTSPTDTTLVSDTLQVKYELTEAAMSGTVKLTFHQTDGSYENTLTLSDALGAEGIHEFPLDLTHYETGGYVVAVAPSANLDFISEGTYDVTLEYRDLHGNPAVNTVVSGMRVDNLPPDISAPVTGFAPLDLVEGDPLPDYASQVSITDFTDVTRSQDPIAGTVLAAGTYTVTIHGVDEVGHDSAFEVQVRVHLANPTNTVLFSASAVKGIAGGPAPGAGTHGLPGDAVLASFGPPAIGEDGHIAFLAKWTSATGALKKGTGVFTDFGCVATLGGDPPVSGANYKSFLDPVISQGRVAFIATLSGVPKGQEQAILSDAVTGDLEVVAQGGADALTGDGATFKSFKQVGIHDRAVTFLAQRAGGTGATKTTAATDLGLWVHGASGLHFALREGDARSGKTIKTLVSFAPGNGSPGQGRGWPSVDADGTVFALAQFTDKSWGFLHAALEPGGAVTIEAQTGTIGATDSPALSGASFASLGLPARNAVPVAAFLASMKPGLGGVAKADARGIFLSTPATAAGPFSLLAREGTPAPETGANFSLLKDPVLAEDGGIAFPATIKGGGLKGAAGTTLWWKRAVAADAVIFAQGSHTASGVPGVSADAEWKAFTSLAIAATRGPLFTATMASGKGGVTAKTSKGVWAADYTGTLRFLFQVGTQEITIPTNPSTQKTVKGFTLLSAVPGSVGVTRSFNDAGEIAWLATFTDGTTAIVKTAVP